MMLSPAWSYALLRLLALVVLAVILGLIFGGIEWWLVAVLGTGLCWQLANLYRLQRWLRHRSQESPPDLSGVWGDLVGLIGGLHRGKQFHKRRVLQLLREFRRLSAALPDAVVLLTASNEIVWFNSMAARLLGLRRKADFGMPIANLVRAPGFVHFLQGPPATAPWIMSLRGGAQFLAFVLIKAGEQKLLLARDVTRERQIEQMRVDFVANASHELRSPLTVITGYLEALAGDEALAEAWRGPLGDMQQQAERMRQIVEDLLELSRLESSTDDAPQDEVDMPALLQRVVASAKAAEAEGRALQLEIASTRGLLGQEREIHSIVANLLGNALKYTPAPGQVRLRWSTDAKGGHLQVTDTGPGIAALHLPRLTERFYRVDRGRARALGGSGLGLAIVKHGLQRHGGRLEIASIEGKGSTFTAHFPPQRLQPG